MKCNIPTVLNTKIIHRMHKEICLFFGQSTEYSIFYEYLWSVTDPVMRNRTKLFFFVSRIQRHEDGAERLPPELCSGGKGEYEIITR